MQTDQATLVLSSLMRTPRIFRSFNLTPEALESFITLQQFTEGYAEALAEADYPGALAMLNQAYRLLHAVPPPATVADLPQGKHPLSATEQQADLTAETEAWQVFLLDLLAQPTEPVQAEPQKRGRTKKVITCRGCALKFVEVLPAVSPAEAAKLRAADSDEGELIQCPQCRRKIYISRCDIPDLPEPPAS